MKHIIFSLFILSSISSFSQFFEDGSYSLTDGGYNTIDIEICENGWKVCNFWFKHDENLVAYSDLGQWNRVNTNGLDENYSGPLGWYLINTEDEIFEIEKTSETEFKVIRGGDRTYIMTIME